MAGSFVAPVRSYTVSPRNERCRSVVLKLRAGGIQDVYDVAGVIAVNGDRLDPEYLARMVPHMGAQEKWETAQRLAREVR